ncbi:MAG: gamma carbonic anhydrase family protein [Elusimicrobia bacterium]|nr:gamma carbonic anhydrase family protein [Elusimicrobiota bacterium]
MISGFKDFMPEIDPTAYVSGASHIIGKVKLGPGVSVWPAAVLRGDVEGIEVGSNSNIQDGTIIHTNYDMPTIIGENVTVGHGVILHGCRVSSMTLIGMGAVLLDGCEVPEQTIVAAGTLVPEGGKLEPGSVYMGVPARRVRGITDEERKLIERNAEEYVLLAGVYRNGARV